MDKTSFLYYLPLISSINCTESKTNQAKPESTYEKISNIGPAPAVFNKHDGPEKKVPAFGPYARDRKKYNGNNG